MPRKKLIRRFEPRYGVSGEMLEIEAKYVAREFDDHLLLSRRDLEEKRAAVRQAWSATDQVLEAAVYVLAERERLAVECMIVRDIFHLYELYCVHLRASGIGSSTPVSPRPERPAIRTERSDSARGKALPFSEWLFDPQT